METHFFERDSINYISIKIDASTAVDLIATEEHKLKYNSQWIAYNAVVRAHNADGTFKADDPTTPENEAFVKVRKKPAKKKAK
tara:strand:- start:188 stop:436 length:249 start_codon:yes stop_codon:yes gene_type:complete